LLAARARPTQARKGGPVKAKPRTFRQAQSLSRLPLWPGRFTGGGFVFSTTGGWGPVSGFSKAKARLDLNRYPELPEFSR